MPFRLKPEELGYVIEVLRQLEESGVNLGGVSGMAQVLNNKELVQMLEALAPTGILPNVREVHSPGPSYIYNQNGFLALSKEGAGLCSVLWPNLTARNPVDRIFLHLENMLRVRQTWGGDSLAGYFTRRMVYVGSLRPRQLSVWDDIPHCQVSIAYGVPDSRGNPSFVVRLFDPRRTQRGEGTTYDLTWTPVHLEAHAIMRGYVPEVQMPTTQRTWEEMRELPIDGVSVSMEFPNEIEGIRRVLRSVIDHPALNKGSEK